MKRKIVLPCRGKSGVWGLGRSVSILVAAMLAAVLASNSAAASPPVCSMRLNVELTPDVPDPGLIRGS